MEGRSMTAQDIAKLGKLLARFLIQFADCFARPAGRQLLQVYFQGLLSKVQRKNAEAIALNLIHVEVHGTLHRLTPHELHPQVGFPD